MKVKEYDVMITAARLKECRKNKKMSPEILAELLDISAVSVWSYESGRTPTPARVLYRYANIFGVTTDFLLGREEA